MPVYLQCPHCQHPQVVPLRRRGRTSFCRQCGWAYLTSKEDSTVWPLSISSIGQLHDFQKAGRQNVYVVEA